LTLFDKGCILSVSERKWPRGCANTPGPGPQKGRLTVDTNILRKDHPEVPTPTNEMVETHYAALGRAACPFCYDGWVFLGFEAEHEQGEHVEVIESVPCRRCRPEAR
jgi:hypothetical protein